jgi:hypothetical protein
MAILFNERGLLVTDECVRIPGSEFPISRVRHAWVTLPESTRGLRLVTTGILVACLVPLAAWAIISGWLADHWIALPLAIGFVVVAAWAGLLDPIALYLEKRRHELWIDVDGTHYRVWQNNKVEVNKALRAITRAGERHRDAEWR